ncbi:MAG: IS66 family insertion sequence element accessory protein TnpB [Albidovulum sp.]|nr:IS66 family insertion sequence element accessory protein TnpB [Albidovulum sp.]
MPANVPEGGIWLSTSPANMRKSFGGLATLVRNEFGGDVFSGGWFVFADRRRSS